jgi:hypothetical protein
MPGIVEKGVVELEWGPWWPGPVDCVEGWRSLRKSNKRGGLGFP